MSPHSLATSLITFYPSLLLIMASSAHEIEDGQQVLIHEKGAVDIDENGNSPTPVLKLDGHGLPLVPQPSEHKDDPLVSPSS